MLGRSLICVALVGWAVLLAASAIAHDYQLGDNAHVVTVNGLCAGWTAYRTQERNLVVLCPGIQPAPGYVELRAYYVVTP